MWLGLGFSSSEGSHRLPELGLLSLHLALASKPHLLRVRRVDKAGGAPDLATATMVLELLRPAACCQRCWAPLPSLLPALLRLAHAAHEDRGDTVQLQRAACPWCFLCN